jgi:hypothetical protein
MKREGDRENGYCSKMVSDHGDWCLFTVLCCRHLFFNVFPFPLCKAQLIGNWYENRRGALKCWVRFFMYCPPIGDFYMYFVPNKFVNFCVRCAISNGAGGICAPIYWRTDVSSANRQWWPSMVSQLCFADFFFVFGPPFLLGQSASVRQ